MAKNSLPWKVKGYFVYLPKNLAHTFNIIPVTNLIGCAGERSWWLSLPFSPLFTEPSCVKCHQFCSSGHLIPKIMTHDRYRSHITALFKPGYVHVNLSWYGHRKQHRSTENPTETRRMEGLAFLQRNRVTGFGASQGGRSLPDPSFVKNISCPRNVTMRVPSAQNWAAWVSKLDP